MKDVDWKALIGYMSRVTSLLRDAKFIDLKLLLHNVIINHEISFCLIALQIFDIVTEGKSLNPQKTPSEWARTQFLICSMNWTHALYSYSFYIQCGMWENLTLNTHFLWMFETSLETFETFTIMTIWSLHFSFFYRVYKVQGHPSVYFASSSISLFIITGFHLISCVECWDLKSKKDDLWWFQSIGTSTSSLRLSRLLFSVNIARFLLD